jgi:hypothetical protein
MKHLSPFFSPMFGNRCSRWPCGGWCLSIRAIVASAMTLLVACSGEIDGHLGGGDGLPSSDDPHMVVVPFEDAPFVPVRADLPDSPEIAVLWGDPSTGPSTMLMRLRRGSIPMHTHSSDYHLIVLDGTMKHWGSDDTEAAAPPLGPGSYWFQPADVAHAEACLTELCLLHVLWAGPHDSSLVP